MTHGEIVSLIWGVADLIRDTFKRGKYQDVILPLTVLRRLDCVLEPTRNKVRQKAAELVARKLQNPDKQLRKASGFAFYNTSQYDFDRLIGDAPHLAANLRNYIAGFSQNMREVIEKFDFDNTITKLDEADLLFQVVERFKKVDLHPDVVDNAVMGTIFEELIRKFNEALDENPGEHFTPRDVVHLMVDLLLAGDEARLARDGVTVSIVDPCCGTGGMLTIFKEHVTAGVRKNGTVVRPPINPGAEIYLFGQEVNPETFAVCKSDLFIKSKDSRDAENILFGSTLSRDRHEGKTFDYLIANPPYGKDWKRDETAVRAEHERGEGGRFGAGLPRISDGQLLFLLHMLTRMRTTGHGGARVAIIMNGSPLFTGDAGSGESEIRRFVLEHDWLEALVALPEQLFYNTGISTYIWIITNRKDPARRGKVQLIDATSFWTQMRKSLGDKRREIPLERGREIVDLHRAFVEGDQVRIYPTAHFGYRKITVERPLRLNFQASPERIVRLDDESAFKNLAISKKKDATVRAREEEQGRRRQAEIRGVVGRMSDELFKNRDAFERELTHALDDAGLELAAALRKTIVTALGERDESADICTGRDGRPEPDPELRDTESVPLSESIHAYFDREVRPHVPDAWIDESKRDERDGEVGVVGYEINFNRYFYKYVPPRPLEEIEAEIRDIEKDIIRLLGEVTGGPRTAAT